MGRVEIAGPVSIAALALVTWTLVAVNRMTAVPTAVIVLGNLGPGAIAFAGLVGFLLGRVIRGRQARNRLGLALTVLGAGLVIGTTFYEYAVFGALTAPGTVPAVPIAAAVWSAFAVGVGILYATVPLFLFPDGRLVSKSWRVPFAVAFVGAAIIVAAVMVLPGPYALAAFVRNPLGIAGLLDPAVDAITFGTALVSAGLVFGIGSVVLRYRRAAAMERQQLKWFVYASVLTAGIQLFWLLSAAAASEPAIVALALSGAIPPAAMTVAILRYRLYDVDLLINRTLVYGVMTGGLAVAFFGLVVVLQALLRRLTGGSEVSVAVSTLGTLALVQPLRRRIQTTVDRRFYRSRFDAARTVDDFAVRLRDQVDFDAVRADLISTVYTTMQPAHLSMWVRPSSRNDSRTPAN
jgi:hypothetical protein